MSDERRRNERAFNSLYPTTKQSPVVFTRRRAQSDQVIHGANDIETSGRLHGQRPSNNYENGRNFFNLVDNNNENDINHNVIDDDETEDIDIGLNLSSLVRSASKVDANTDSDTNHNNNNNNNNGSSNRNVNQDSNNAMVTDNLGKKSKSKSESKSESSNKSSIKSSPNRSRLRNSGKKKAVVSQGIIPISEGWPKIYKHGIEPFLKRVLEIGLQLKQGGAALARRESTIPQQQYIQTYDGIFTMCIQREPFNYSGQLYLRHSDTLTDFFNNEFVPKLIHADKQHPVVLLREWVQEWQCGKWVVDGMSRMFMYLDRFHVPNSEDLLNTSEQGYTLFKQCIYNRFHENVKNAILNCINNERDNEEQNRELLRDAIHVFLELGNKLSKTGLALYKQDFHGDLVQSTTNYYRRMSRIWLNQLTTPQYLSKVENCIESEKQRMLVYVDRHSQPAIIHEMQEQLLRVHLSELLDRPSGMNEMLKNAISCNESGTHMATTDSSGHDDTDSTYINRKYVRRHSASGRHMMMMNDDNSNNSNSVSNSLIGDVSIDSGNNNSNNNNNNNSNSNNNNNGNGMMMEEDEAREYRRHKSDLARLYQLYSEIDTGHTLIAQRMKKYISKLGSKIILKSKELAKSNQTLKNNENESKNNENNENDGGSSSSVSCSESDLCYVTETDHELILSLINLHNRFNNIVRTQFCGNSVFTTFLKQAFEEFINKEYYLSALLARYSNDILKKGSKISTNNASSIDRIMNNIVMIYGYIRDKDIFERDFQRYLSMRLLENLSQSEEYERCMIGKLRNEAGYHWTNKLEDMFKDIENSKWLNQQFQSYMKKTDSKFKNNNNDNNCNNNKDNENTNDFSVFVCTTGAWPSGHGGITSYFTFDNKHIEQSRVNMPSNLSQLFDKFHKFYEHKYSNGRKLLLQMDKGKAEITINFRSNYSKIIVCSTYQMIILLLFNNKNILTFEEIVNETKIPINDCQLHLLSMAHPKVKLLRKSPNVRKLSMTDKFKINSNYDNPRTRVIVPLIYMRIQPINVVISNDNNDNNDNDSSMVSSNKMSDDRESDKTFYNFDSCYSGNSSCFSIDKENIEGFNNSNSEFDASGYKNIHGLRDIFIMRKAMMDAAIVRVMKARKTIEHSELVEQVTKQLSTRFEPKSLNIKKRIENLIEIEYMERDEKNRQLYHYKL